MVPGETERVVVSLSEEEEADEPMEKKRAESPTVTAAVGERCEVREGDVQQPVSRT